MAEQIKYDIAVTGTAQAVTNINAVTMAQQRLNMSSANAGVALQNLNFVIRDSPYFFRDFSLGLLAVGNNLNPLIDSMLRMKKEAQSVGQTLSGALWTALKGPAGVVLAFSALVTVLQAVTFAMSKTKSGAKDAKDEIEDLRDAVDDLGNSFSEAIKKQSEYEKSTEAASLMARINQMEGMKKKGGEYKTMVVKGEAQVFWSAWSQSQQEDLDDLYKALKEIQVPFSNFINKTEQIAKAAEQGVGGLRKLDMSYKDITDSIRGFNKMRDSYDAESKEFAYYDRIVRTLKLYQDEIDKTHKKKKNYLEAEALGYAFASEEEEKLFKKRMDLHGNIKERLIRAGVSPDQAESFAFGMSSQLQSPDVAMWGGGYKKVTKPDPLKDLSKPVKESTTLIQALAREAQTMGDVLADAFMRGAKAADVFNAIAGKLIGGLINFFIGTAFAGPAGGASMAGGSMLKGVYSLPQGGSSGTNITINGELSAKQDKFVVDFKRAETRFSNNRGLFNVG